MRKMAVPKLLRRPKLVWSLLLVPAFLAYVTIGPRSSIVFAGLYLLHFSYLLCEHLAPQVRSALPGEKLLFMPVALVLLGAWTGLAYIWFHFG